MISPDKNATELGNRRLFLNIEVDKRLLINSLSIVIEINKRKCYLYIPIQVTFIMHGRLQRRKKRKRREKKIYISGVEKYFTYEK